MKIDLFYEFCQGTGRPWPTGADHRLYQQVLQQVDVGEAAGFNCFWSVEHHGSVEFAHMPAPEIFLTAVAARTKQMRVGHAVVLTHPLFNHPVRVAERAAVLDNLSDGRLEIGFGRSTIREWDVFHIDGETTRPILREALEIIPRMWTEDEFSYSSEHVKIDNAHLERLGEACAERNRWEFCFSLNPLRLAQGTGSRRTRSRRSRPRRVGWSAGGACADEHGPRRTARAAQPFAPRPVAARGDRGGRHRAGGAGRRLQLG